MGWEIGAVGFATISSVPNVAAVLPKIRSCRYTHHFGAHDLPLKAVNVDLHPIPSLYPRALVLGSGSRGWI